MEWIFVCPFIVLFCVQTSRAAFSLAGPYEVILERFEECEEHKGQLGMTLSAKSYRKSKSERVFNANITTNFGLENVTANYLVDKWGSGGWGKNALSGETSEPCQRLIKNLPKVARTLFSAAGLEETCVLPAGKYVITDLPNTYCQLEKFPSLPYGRYRATHEIFKDKKLVACFRGYAELAQIPSKSFG